MTIPVTPLEEMNHLEGVLEIDHLEPLDKVNHLEGVNHLEEVKEMIGPPSRSQRRLLVGSRGGKYKGMTIGGVV